MFFRQYQNLLRCTIRIHHRVWHNARPPSTSHGDTSWGGEHTYEIIEALVYFANDGEAAEHVGETWKHNRCVDGCFRG